MREHLPREEVLRAQHPAQVRLSYSDCHSHVHLLGSLWLAILSDHELGALQCLYAKEVKLIVPVLVQSRLNGISVLLGKELGSLTDQGTLAPSTVPIVVELLSHLPIVFASTLVHVGDQQACSQNALVRMHHIQLSRCLRSQVIQLSCCYPILHLLFCFLLYQIQI